VNESALVPAELEAIAAAIREVSIPARAQTRPIPLPHADRAMASSRAELLELASRWAEEAPRLLRPQLPGVWQVRVTDIDVIDGAAMKAELREGWVGGGKGKAPVMALAIHGQVIEAVAARRCGDSRGRVDGRRAPSPATLRLFDATGWALVASWLEMWRAPEREKLLAAREPELSPMMGQELLRVTLLISGAVQGRLEVMVVPSALTSRPLAPPLSTRSALERLAEVEVEVRVELGALQLSLEELQQLQPGACFALPTFVDSRVPVFVGGVLKAWGTPVVHRGVMAVAIEQVVGEQPGEPGGRE
jgi:flagellar motor switch/type III secretory pathway protein FliN